MDAIFQVGEIERNDCLRMLMQNFGCTYVCMWSYLPHLNNCLLFWDGRYEEESNQASSSSRSLGLRLFDEYRLFSFSLVNDRVPGFAFLSNCPYMELSAMELQRMAHVDAQRLFYQEAGIKTAVFMGCRSGEIEFGWSNVSQLKIQNEKRNWFQEDFVRQSPPRDLLQPLDPNRASSSSCSLISLSMDSPDIPTTSHLPETLQIAPIVQPITSSSINPLSQALENWEPIVANTISTNTPQQTIQPPTSSTNNLQQVIQSLFTRSILSRISGKQSANLTQSIEQQRQQQIQQRQQPYFSFSLTRESEYMAMTRAILSMLTSPLSPVSSSSSTTIHALPQPHHPGSQKVSAFKRFIQGLPPRAPIRDNLRTRMSTMKRAITYYRCLDMVRRERLRAANQSTSSMVHHMISERKRRDKISKVFQVVRSLLPPDNKKDQASVLMRTAEYITTLKTQVAELSRRNEQLEAQLLHVREVADHEAIESSGERVTVHVRNVPESTSNQQRIIDVQIALRGQCPVKDMVIRVLEFLKMDNNVNLVSVEANSFVGDSGSINRVMLRLHIEGDEWDASAFQEALKRVAITWLNHSTGLI